MFWNSISKIFVINLKNTEKNRKEKLIEWSKIISESDEYKKELIRDNDY